jgi:hypothetical protein
VVICTSASIFNELDIHLRRDFSLISIPHIYSSLTASEARKL